MAKHRIKQTMPYDSPGTRFLMPKILAKFQRGHPKGAPNEGGGQIQIGDVRLTSRYISETVQYIGT